MSKASLNLRGRISPNFFLIIIHHFDFQLNPNLYTLKIKNIKCSKLSFLRSKSRLIIAKVNNLPLFDFDKQDQFGNLKLYTSILKKVTFAFEDFKDVRYLL